MSEPKAGFHFRERMAGWVSTLATRSPEAGAHQATADRQWAEVVLDVDYDDLDHVLKVRDTPAHLTGTALIAGLSPVVMQVRSGTLRLFVQDVRHVQRWTMEYRLDLRSQEGRVYELHGVKRLDRGLPHVAWPRTTTLFTEVKDTKDRVVAAGIMRLTLGDFLRQMTTMRVTNTDRWSKRVTGVPKFYGMFSAMLLRQFGGLLSGFWAFPPRPALPEPRGKPKGDVPTWWCTGHGADAKWHQDGPSDDAWLRLTRHHPERADRGPVLLAPGFGMSTAAYVTDTIDTNLTEYLMSRGFDVWLFDYRASPDLKSARTRFTIDDVAREDWPAGIEKVFAETGSRVQVFAHCVGSMSFQMAMLWDDNVEMRKQVQSAVCSQVTVHPRSTWFNTFKVRVGLGPILERMSPILEPEEERTVWNMVYDAILRVAPTPRGEGCGNAVCQWITAYFGLTHRHWQLDDDTHNDLGRLFGVSGVYPLRHIGNMVAAGKSLDHHGNDVYVKSDAVGTPGNAKNLRIPILFLAGQRNKIFFPETSKRTFEWLRASNPQIHYERRVLPEYAHLDGIIGRDAARDVYPCIAEHFEATLLPRLYRSQQFDVS